LYTTTRFIDSKIKNMVKDIQNTHITKSTENLIKNISENQELDLMDLVKLFDTTFEGEIATNPNLSTRLDELRGNIFAIFKQPTEYNAPLRIDYVQDLYKLALECYDGDKFKALQFLNQTDILKKESSILNQVLKDAQRGLISIDGQKSLHEQALNSYKAKEQNPDFSKLIKNLSSAYQNLNQADKITSQKLFETYIENPSTYAADKLKIEHSDAEAFALDLIDEITKPYLQTILTENLYSAVKQKFKGDKITALRFLDLCQQSTIINSDKVPFTKAAAEVNDTTENKPVSTNYGATAAKDKNCRLTIDIKNATITTKSYISVNKSGLDENYQQTVNNLFNIEVDGTFAFDKSASQTFTVTSTPLEKLDQKTQEAATKIKSLFQKTLGGPNLTIFANDDSALGSTRYSSSTISTASTINGI
ncbi:MAG: hypothetical protein WCG10_07600, partial [Chlamydiota bacterium]